MLNEEMRKYLNILVESEQVDEIKAPKWLKGAALAGAIGTGMHITDPGQTEFAKYLESQIEQTQDPVAVKQMEKDLDSFTVATLEGDDVNDILKRYGWERANTIPDWAKEEEPEQEPEKEPGAKPGQVTFDYNQIDVKPTTARR